MTHELLVAGFGGQGVLAIGKLLAEAAVAQDLNASWLPSYGAEVRGGTASCSCVMTEGEVRSPVVTAPGELILMNQLSFDRYLPSARQDALVLVNSSIISTPVEGELRGVYVPCNDLAEMLGTVRCANMVMAGAYAQATGYLRANVLRALVEEMFAQKSQDLVRLNLAALEAGAECVR